MGVTRSERAHCPVCRTSSDDGQGRTCSACGYRGDWIQPGHEHLYACGLWHENGVEEPYGAVECECEKGYPDP
jgi:hypothetical protein